MMFLIFFSYFFSSCPVSAQEFSLFSFQREQDIIITGIVRILTSTAFIHSKSLFRCSNLSSDPPPSCQVSSLYLTLPFTPSSSPLLYLSATLSMYLFSFLLLSIHLSFSFSSFLPSSLIHTIFSFYFRLQFDCFDSLKDIQQVTLLKNLISCCYEVLEESTETMPFTLDVRVPQVAIIQTSPCAGFKSMNKR